MALSFKVNKTTKTQFALGNPAYVGPAINEYLTKQSGPLSGIGAAEAIGLSEPALLNIRSLID